MKNQLQNRCFNTYKFYFSPKTNDSSQSPVNGKENIPKEGNKLNYQFYFQKPSHQKQKNPQKLHLTPKSIQYSEIMKTSIRKAVSQLIDYTQLVSVSFECFLGAAIIFYEFISKKQVNQNELPTLILSCLFISSKLFEINELTASQIAQMTGNNVSKGDILTFEGLIMEKLEFNVFLQSPVQNEIDKIATIEDEESKQKIQMLIQMCLLRGNQVLNDEKLINFIRDYASDSRGSEQAAANLKTYLKTLERTQQLRSLTMKWSFKIDTDGVLQGLQL